MRNKALRSEDLPNAGGLSPALPTLFMAHSAGKPAPAHMNLNTALMSHLQKPPMAPKSTLIAFIVHPTFLFALNLDLPQGLQLPCPCQRLP